MKPKKDPVREAIIALHAAGRGGEVTEYLKSTGDTLARRYAATNANGDLSDLGRQRQLARTYSRARADVDAELVRRGRAAVLSDRSDATSVFGVKGLSGDPETLMVSMRQANDRVAGVDSAEELSELLRRATRQGDEIMARAVAARAMDLRVDGPLHEFVEDRPELDGAVERLWKTNEAESDTLMYTMYLANLKPSELSGTSSGEIDRPADMPDPPADLHAHFRLIHNI